MKEGWEYKKLGEICDFRSGFAFKSNKFTKIGEPIIRISDIQNEEIDDSNLVYFDPKSYTEDLSKYLIYPDDILIAMSGGTTGKLGINTSNRTFYLNQRVGVFRENKKYLNHRYLFYYLHTKSEESLKIAAGAAQPNLSTAQIKSFIIPIPSLSEQQRIVNYLDAAFAKIDAMKANAEKSLGEAKALFQASLKEMLEPKEGWEYIDFKDVFPVKMGKTPPRGDKSSWDENKETNNKWVSIADISNNEGKIIKDTKEYISDSAAEKINKVSKGSLLMSFKLSIGRMAFAGDDLYTNEAIIAIPESNKYILRFIYYYLLSYNWLSLTEGNEKVKGATLNKSSIGKIQLPVLSLSEQQRIVATLDALKSKVDRLQANFEKISQECDALKQALLREVFEG